MRRICVDVNEVHDNDDDGTEDVSQQSTNEVQYERRKRRRSPPLTA